MFPIKNSVATRYPPTVTWGLIAINTIVFLYQLSLPEPARQLFLSEFALVPARYFGEFANVYSPASMFDYLPFFTNMFLNGGWLHLILNMWTLGIFGPAVEDRLGVLRFLAFYLAAGVAASFAHALVNANSTVPALGASGAIAGIIGCYVRMFPLARLVIMIPILIFPFFFEVPAFTFAALWLLTQIVPGIASVFAPSETGGIAWWAHIGGFAASWLLMPIMRRPARSYRPYYADEGQYGFRPDGRRSNRGRPWG